ncbi:hypothetical protein, partial [Streptomyces lonegramiae]
MDALADFFSGLANAFLTFSPILLTVAEIPSRTSEATFAAGLLALPRVPSFPGTATRLSRTSGLTVSTEVSESTAAGSASVASVADDAAGSLTVVP